MNQMRPLPHLLASRYRAAAPRDIRSWSFGAVTTVRPADPSRWEATRGTLDDERTFGPRIDDRCACGKYEGAPYRRMICDRCGVKVTSAECRRTRFGHIALPTILPHPYDSSVEFRDVPVLPSAFRESVRGKDLDRLYEAIVSLPGDANRQTTSAAVKRVIEFLIPVVLEGHRWNLTDALALAHGLALVEWDSPPDKRCNQCGYPIAGLRITVCPGCGGELTRM